MERGFMHSVLKWSYRQIIKLSAKCRYFFEIPMKSVANIWFLVGNGCFSLWISRFDTSFCKELSGSILLIFCLSDWCSTSYGDSYVNLFSIVFLNRYISISTNYFP